MKNLTLLVWITQLGLSIALPLAGFILLAVWLRNTFAWGNWVIFLGAAMGIYSAIQGMFSTLRSLRRIASSPDKPEAHPVAFNEHD